MKNVLFATLISILAWESSLGQAPAWQWANSSGGTSLDKGQAVAVDPSGDVVVAGYFKSDSISIDTATLVNAGGGYNDVYIVKYDPAGNFIWAVSAGGSGSDQAEGVATDASGNVYVTGYFQSPTMTFDSITLSQAGGSDVFVVKYDPMGNVLWASSAGGSSYDYGQGIATDAAGNAYVTGSFESGSIFFGTDTLSMAGGADVFLAKYDESGNVIWAKRAGGMDADLGKSVSLDSFGNVYVTGSFTSNFLFGPDNLVSSGSFDVFVLQYDSSGGEHWGRGFGGMDYDRGTSNCTDADGNVYVGGHFNSPSMAVASITLSNSSSGFSDLFMAKFDSSGTVQWANNAYGYLKDEWVFGLACDPGGSLYATGGFNGSYVVFGTDTLINTGTGTPDYFVVKTDAGGNVLWSKSGGGSLEDLPNSIAVDMGGNAIVTGVYYSPSMDFGSDTLINTLASTGDVFVAKLDWFTGMDELAAGSGISIYPNPFSSHAIMAFDRPLMDATLTVLNSLGQVEYEVSLFAGSTLRIERGNLPAGIHFFRLEEDSNVIGFFRMVVAD